MSNLSVEQQLRHFLMWVVAFIFIGTIVELILLEHYLETLQWIPYFLCGLGLITIITARISPGRNTLLMLRWVMVLVAIGSLFGMTQHFSGNLEFAREINPNYSFMQALWPAVNGGNPLLAPGILFLAGVLGIAITYKHPKLEKQQ